MSYFTSSFPGFRSFVRFVAVLVGSLFLGHLIAEAARAQVASPFGPAQELAVGSVTISVAEKEQIHKDWLRSASIRPEGVPGLAIAVFPAPAPNVFGSPSWSQHSAFSQFLLRYLPGQGVLSPGLNPTAYQPLRSGLYMPRDVMVTSFNSWWGIENPGAPFASEYGNRLHAGLVVEGDCNTQFALIDVNFSFTSTDGSLDFIGDLSGTTLNGTTRVGIACGPDGLLRTPDDIVYAGNEPDTTLLDVLVYTGAGNALWPGEGNPGAGQAEIDETVDYLLDNNVHIEIDYSVLTYAGSSVLLPAIFHDGFETGDASAWSVSVN